MKFFSLFFGHFQRICYEGMLHFERLLRFHFEDIPKYTFHRFPSMNKIVNFFFVYVMLQALALLWGFLFTLGAMLGENMISIFTMPYQQALCVLLVHVSVVGIVLSFGRAMWILTWQSIQDFPLIRRIIAYECRPQTVILASAIPMLCLLTSLLLIPSICRDEEEEGKKVQQQQEQAVHLIAISWKKTFCEESYVKFLTNKYPVFQRSMRISTVIAVWQFVQACLEILPPWKTSLANLSKTASFLLTFSLVLLNVSGLIWTFEWICRHVKYELSPLSQIPTCQWEQIGMVLLTCWVMWFVGLTSQTYPNVETCVTSQKKLVELFERIKYTFVFGQAIIFFRACLHPQMGFVHAQLELTIINLLLPSIYVISLITLRMVVTLLTWKGIALSVPLSIGVGYMIFLGSKMPQPHAFFALSAFFFDSILRWSHLVFMSIDTEKKNMKALTSSKQTSSPSNNRTIGPFLRQILTSSSSMTHQKLRAHQAIKKLVQVGFGVLFLFVFCICGFSILSVLQQSAQWFPDATTVTYHGNTSIEIQHTSVVKLHIHLEPSPTHEEDVMANTSSTTYASCSNTWHGLSMIDYGFLAEAAYFDPSSDAIEKFLTRIFTNDSQIQIRLPPENTKTGSKLDFYEVFFPNLNTSVLSVKGTDIWRFTDFVEDVKMFLEPVIFTILSGIFPTIRIWPDVTFSTLIELYSEIVALFGLEHEFWYYNELLEYIEGIQDRQVVLTGHSMGGGIARFVGSITGKTSITFSPPGFVQSYSKLVHHVKGQKTKVDRNKLHHLSVAIIPEYDPITMIDAQSGLIQRISCNTPHLSMQLSCHMLEGTLCNLIEHCGDSRRRVNGCKFEHRISSLKEDIGPILVSLFSPEILGALTIGTMILFSVALHGKSISSSSPTTHTSTSSYGKNGFTILTEMLSPPKLPPQQRRIRHLLAKAKQKIG